LNEERLFGLAVPAFYYTELDATHFKEIRRMAPATTITVSEDGFRENEYWRPDPERRLPFKTDDEILEALCELLFRTMRSYTRNRFPVMATLSGGLDSSAVVSVVSRLLAETGRSLTAVCAVLPRNASSGFEDERNYIHCFENWDNLKLLYDCAPGRGPFENVAETVWGADSPAISPHHYQISSYADVARAHGSRLILHGIGGEVGLTSKATGYLAELLCSGHLTQVWREASAQARREERSLWGLLLREVVRPSLPQSWIRLIRPASSRDFLKPNGFPFSSCFMQRLLDHKVDHIQKLTRVQQSGFPDHRANQLNAILGMRRFSGVINAHAGYQHVGHAFPLADRRIVEFCLAAPGRLKMRDGYTRNLVRGALSNLLPSVIQRRTTKGSAVLDIAERYNRQLPAIRAELSAISNADPVRTIVDVDQLRILAASDLPTSEAAWNEIDKLANLWLVPSSIYLMQFLRQFNEFR
jgi:asparagine synthase (glutamine-hydrolysing)